MFAVFLLQGALDFADNGLTLQRILGADHHHLVIMPDGGLPLISKSLRPPGQRLVDSYPASPVDSPTAWPAPPKAHRRKPGHVGGKAPECRGKTPGQGNGGIEDNPTHGRASSRSCLMVMPPRESLCVLPKLLRRSMAACRSSS